jgi:hypothetical protein
LQLLGSGQHERSQRLDQGEEGILASTGQVRIAALQQHLELAVELPVHVERWCSGHVPSFIR